jgi:mannose-1-phosphate guanylyltransferase
MDHAAKVFMKHALGISAASSGSCIVLTGSPPNRPETAYGYIQLSEHEGTEQNEPSLRRVRSFIEKPCLADAIKLVADGRQVWDSGIFFWKAEALLKAARVYACELVNRLEPVASAYGTDRFEYLLNEAFPLCPNISIDHLIFEPLSRDKQADIGIFCTTVDFGWSDLGSWRSVYDALTSFSVGEGTSDAHSVNVICSERNLIRARGKDVVLIDLNGYAVIDTEHALLIGPLSRIDEITKIAPES